MRNSSHEGLDPAQGKEHCRPAAAPERGGDGFDPPRQDELRGFFFRFLKGILIGIGAILPGLSGAVLAVIFGLYDPIMRFLSRIRYRFLDNFRYFLPLGLGGFVGILIFSFFVSAAFGRYEALFICLFIGLVLGTFPSLWREAGRDGHSARDYLLLITALSFIFILMLLGGRQYMDIRPNIFVWLLAGAAIGLGVIVPGLSPSNFLIYFGLYKKMTDAVKSLQMSAILPLSLGLATSVLLLARPIRRLFDQARSAAYHVILGLVLGSSLGVFPAMVFPALRREGLEAMKMSLPVAILAALLLLALGVWISALFAKLEEKFLPDEEKESCPKSPERGGR